MEDSVYQRLAKRAIERHGSSKSLSKELNLILESEFSREALPASMFGAWKGKGMSSRGLREEGEPH